MGKLTITIEEMEKKFDKAGVSPEVVKAGVDYDTYADILVLYGQKQLQSVVLLSEIKRLNERE